MPGTGVEQGGPLRRRPRDGDRHGADPIGDLDRGKADAARCRRDGHDLAVAESGDIDQRAISGQIRHPERRGGFPAQRGRMLDHELGGKADQFAICRPAHHRAWRHDADGVARRKAFHVRTDGFDHARRLKPEPRRQVRRLDIAAGTQQRLGAIQSERLDADPHLAGRGFRHLGRFDAQDFGPAILVETNDTSGLHGWFDSKSKRRNPV